jgi:hypothetical protein
MFNFYNDTMKRVTLFVLTSLFLTSFAISQTTKSGTEIVTQNNWKTLEESNYSIQYPNSWELNKSGQMGTSFMLLTQLSSVQDKFRENVNLIIQDLTGQNIDLNKYVEISEDQIKSMEAAGNLTESKRLNSNGKNFQKVIYTLSQGGYNLNIEQYYWVEKGKAYVLTLTCETSEFAKYKEIGEKILNSFKLKVK